jgi:hypothetical protein
VFDTCLFLGYAEQRLEALFDRSFCAFRDWSASAIGSPFSNHFVTLICFASGQAQNVRFGARSSMGASGSVKRLWLVPLALMLLTAAALSPSPTAAITRLLAEF